MPDVVKCLVWDLDGTVWSGTLLESDRCRLRPGIRAAIQELDRRGLLQSVASRSDSELALRLLRKKELARYFLEPRIGWENKVRSLQRISASLGVAVDAMAFIDDEPFERQQAERLLPGLRAYPAALARWLPGLPEFSPPEVTEESRSRRLAYRGMAERDAMARDEAMTHGEFLRWCATELTVGPAEAEDLPRILELLARTHQLNATGVVWPREEVEGWLDEPDWHVYVARLRDRFVDYGRIGVAACRVRPSEWELVVFLLSCRVLARGIAGWFLSWVRGRAAAGGAEVFTAIYRPGPRNGSMRTLYGLAGLAPAGQGPGGIDRFAGPAVPAPAPPPWLTVDEGKV